MTFEPLTGGAPEGIKRGMEDRGKMEQRRRTHGLPRSGAIALCLLAVAVPAPAAEPLRAHFDNRRLPFFRGRPTLLVGSTEHYGAVLNPDFDYRRYLDTVAASGLNLIRLFTGAYLEKPGDFGIRQNTLAPASGRALLPWARSETPGYRLGGDRFDLERWDPAYFARLKEVIAQAGKRGIVAEVTLFSAYYGGGWEVSPLHPDNNVNETPRLPKERVQTLDDGGPLARQEALVRKLVAELAPFDNLYYEIQNEPWADRPEPLDIIHPYIVREDMKDDWRFWKNKIEGADAASRAWQARIAYVVRDEEKRLGVRHLLAQNYVNFGYPLKGVDPNVDIVNFHYAWPHAAARNLGLDRILTSDETGFAGGSDDTYRQQAWEFLLAGGTAFDHLDYSFAVGYEDGTATNEAPGGGSPALRTQLGVLRRFLEELDLVAFGPDGAVVRSAPGAQVSAVSARSRQYAFYIRGDGATVLGLELPAGDWRAEWRDTRTGSTVETETFRHEGRRRELESPKYDHDIALRLVAVGRGR